MRNFTPHLSVCAGICFKGLLALFLSFSFAISLYGHPLQGGEEKVTISEKDVSLRSVLKSIKKQTGYNFFYTQEYVNDGKKVTLNVKNESVEKVLQDLLGMEYEWVYNKEAVSIRKKKWEEINSSNADTTKVGKSVLMNISGKVTDANGNPVPGATILIKSTREGTNANENGEFRLAEIGLNTVLLISSIGYEKREVVVKGATILTRLNVNVSDLDAAVVQGYGTTSRRLTTGNIAKVTAEEIEKQPVINPLQALQGKVPGLDIVQTKGYASSPFKVELRGRSAINSRFTADPLYVIDGVPLTVLELGTSSSYENGSTGFDQTGIAYGAGFGGQSPFFSINPSEIESIEVLKDADATSIYGSRGANGVILITTKKGKPGRTKFDVHIQQGITKATRFYKLLNTPQYLDMRREALKNNSIPIDGSSAPDLTVWDTTRYTDWQRTLYGGSGKATDIQMGLSGGDTRTTFRISAGYNNTTNILSVSGADQRSSASVHLNHQSLNRRFSVAFSSTFAYTKSDMVNLPGNYNLPPNAPAIFDAEGNLNYEGWGGENTAGRQLYPFATLKQPYVSKTNFLNSNLVIKYEPVKKLVFSASFGYNNAQANQQQFTTIASQDPLLSPTGSAAFGFNNNKNWIVEPQINYSFHAAKGTVTAFVGGSLQQASTDGLSVFGSGYTSDALIKTVSNAPVQTTTDNYSQYRYAALFGRIGYNYENRYILNINARRDGSSRFGRNNQFGNFASLGAAWIFTEETWLKDLNSVLSFGKLRASYGTAGSDQVGDYQYITRWSSSGLLPYNGTMQLRPTQHANPDFQWQVNKKLEAAMDLGFFMNRLNLSIAWYRNRCGNQLVSFPKPAYTGFTSVTANSPALVENTGWEFTMDAKIISSKDFNWTITANASINRNKLVSYPNLALSPYAGTLIVGETLNFRRLLHYTGVDPLTGQYTFSDKTHDGQAIYDYTGKNPDDTYVYNINPDFFGGLGMNFNYKDLQLNLFFNIKKQIGRNAISQLPTPGAINNQPVEVLSRWRNPGDIANIARFSTYVYNSDYFYANVSDAAYTDASFIRLSTLSVAYSLPASYIKPIGIQSCSIFLHTQNLFVITKYKGTDPETQSFGSLPPARTLVAGLSLNF